MPILLDDPGVVAVGDKELGKRAVGLDLAVDLAALLGHVDKVDERVHVLPCLKGAVQRRLDVEAGHKRGEEEVLCEQQEGVVSVAQVAAGGLGQGG